MDSPRCAPTDVFPSPRNSIRAAFKTFHSFATIKVGTGASAATFYVHKQPLTAASPFFDAALNGKWTEQTDQTVSLPEEKPEIFEWFVYWLYSGCLTTPNSTVDCQPCASPLGQPVVSHTPASLSHHIRQAHQNMFGDGSSSLGTVNTACTPAHSDGDLRNAAGSPKYFLLLDLYGLSDRLLTTSLSNHVLDTIARLAELTNSVPTPSDTWILYGEDPTSTPAETTPTKPKTKKSHRSLKSGTEDEPMPDVLTSPITTKPIEEVYVPRIRPNAPIVHLILDLFAYKKTDRLLETHRDEWHPKFLRDLVVRLKRPVPDSLDRHRLLPITAATGFGGLLSVEESGLVCDGCGAVVLRNAIVAASEMRDHVTLDQVYDVSSSLGLGAGSLGLRRANGLDGLAGRTNLHNGPTSTRGTAPAQSQIQRATRYRHTHRNAALANPSTPTNSLGANYINTPAFREAERLREREMENIPVPPHRCGIGKCERFFCSRCVKRGYVMCIPGQPGAGGTEIGPCKPWVGAMCARYHEHPELEMGDGARVGGAVGGCGR